jgi:tripartite-type tricarboxylate transporter receptor subunit TctC
MIKKFVRHAVVLLSFTASALCVAQESYPTKPVRLIVPFPPGGAADVVGRVVAVKLSQSLGQNVVVENKAGANGTIGAGYVAKAAPDGYTLLLSTLGPITVIPQVQKVAYDPIKDLEPVTQAVSLTLGWFSKRGKGPKSVAELLALDRAGARLSVGTSGSGSPNHLAVLQLNQFAGTHLTHIPYKGESPAIADLVGGQIDLVVTTVVSAAPFLSTGDVQALAVGGTKRAHSLASVPTMAEAGVAGYEADAWQGFFVPAKTPRPIKERLQRELAKILKSDEIREYLGVRGTDSVGDSSEAFEAMIRREYVRYGNLIGAVDLKLD